MFASWLRRKTAVSGKKNSRRARRVAPRRPGLESLESRRVLAPVINEIHFNPLFGDNDHDQYVEIRGLPNETLANGTYLVAVEGDSNGAASPGVIHTVFDLAGLQVGSNGFLVMTQQDNGYTVDPNAALLTGTDGGFAGLRAAGEPMGTDRFSDTAALSNRIDFIVGSNTFLLIQSDTAPIAGHDVDANNDGDLDGAADNWTILDAVSVLDGGAGDYAYANLVFAVNGAGIKPVGAQVVSVTASSWVGRNDDTTGSAPADWVSGQTQERGDDAFLFRLNNNTAVPAAFAGRNLDHLGAPNFAASIQGVVFDDTNADGVQQMGEAGLPDVPVFIDQNNNGVLDDYGTTVEPDSFAVSTVIQNRTPGVTLTVTDSNNVQFPEDTIRVTVVNDVDYASTGQRVFAHSDIGFFESDRRLRVDFYEHASSISIDIIGAPVSTTVGRLRVFNAAGVELQTVTTSPLANHQAGTMTVSRPQADIAYAVAYSEPGPGLSPFGRLDNLRFTQPERTTTSGADGTYEIPRVVSQSTQLPGFDAEYTVQQVRPAGYLQTFPTGIGSHSVVAADTANIADIDFGNHLNAAPLIDDQAFVIPENTSPSSVVGLVAADDADAEQTLTFQITGGTGAGLFTINPNNGLLLVAIGAQLDFETEESYTLEITVTDNAPEPASDTATVTVNLSDVNEPPTDIFLSSNTIAEDVDTSGGSVLAANLSASDPDANAMVFFTLVGQMNNDGGLFEIVGNELRLKQGVTLDFESQSTLTITIEAGDDSEQFQKSFILDVTDVDEAPTMVTLDPNTVSEDADTSSPVLVGNLATDDPDPNFTYSFEIAGGADADQFEIVDAQLFIKAGAMLDFETQPQLEVAVAASDGHGHDVETTLTVNVADANDAPLLADQTFSIPENSPADTIVGTIAATDPDAGQTVTFAVLGGSGAGIFSIDSGTGAITVVDSAALNFETVQSFDLLVEATDDGSPARSSQATITIELTDLDDEPTGVALNGDSVSEAEDTSGGPVFVGQLVSIGGPADMFMLVAGEGDTHNSVFQIDGDSLSLVQGAVLDHETLPVLSIRVSVSNGMVSAESVLTVNVTDVNEAPTGITLSNDTVIDTADTASGPVAVGELAAVDPDSPGAFGEYTFTLEDGDGDADNGAFQITGNLLEFKQGVMLDHTVQDSYSVRVRADDGEHSTVQTFTIHVAAPNQAPFAGDDSRVTAVSQAVTIVVLANDGDDDGLLNPASVTIVTPPVNGTAEVNADGTITYAPDAEFVGLDTFQYTVADDRGAVSNAALVTIDVRTGPPWQNPIEHMDIDGNGLINILDLLALVDFLRAHGVGHTLNDPRNPGDPMVDVDGNGMAELNDLLLLVQRLREQQAVGEPERESQEQIAAPAGASSLLFALNGDDPWFVDEIAADRAMA